MQLSPAQQRRIQHLRPEICKGLSGKGLVTVPTIFKAVLPHPTICQMTSCSHQMCQTQLSPLFQAIRAVMYQMIFNKYWALMNQTLLCRTPTRRTSPYLEITTKGFPLALQSVILPFPGHLNVRYWRRSRLRRPIDFPQALEITADQPQILV